MARGNDDARLRTIGVILRTITDEVIEELSDHMDEQSFAAYMSMTGKMFEWVGTGNLEVLPEMMRPFACRITGEPYQQTDDQDGMQESLLEIEGCTSVS